MALTPEHEGLHRIFAEDKAVIASVLSQLRKAAMPVPARAEPLNIDLTEVTGVLERRSDTVLRVTFGSGDPGDDFILAVESQTDPDDTRLDAWPHFIGHLRDKHKMQVIMLVVTSKAATARWARRPIRTGAHGMICQVTTPVVAGPDNMPAISSVQQASRDLPFAVFAALTHSRGRRVRAILETLATALESTDQQTASGLSEYTEAGLGSTPGFRIWRALMSSGTFTYVSETRAQGRAEGRVEGRAEGRAEDILRILQRRRITVDDTSRRRIESCADLGTLDKWFDRAFDVSNAEDLFSD